MAIALPDSSRKAWIMASLARQKPVSSVAVIVPEKALLKRETFRITDLPTSFALNEGGPDCDMVPPEMVGSFRMCDWQ